MTLKKGNEAKSDGFRNLGSKKGFGDSHKNEVLFHSQFTIHDELSSYTEVPNEKTLSIPINSKIHFK